MVRTGVVTLIVLVILIILFSTVYYSMLNAFSELKDRLNGLNNTLAIIYKSIEMSNKSSGADSFIQVYVLNSNPEAYVGKLVVTVGEIHSIVTVPEIRLPYNAVIVFKNQNFGVSTSLRFKEGGKVIVKGIVTRGFQERLTGSGWERDKEVYYIIVTEIEEI